MEQLPKEVISEGRRDARRTRIPEEDGVSFAAEAWWEHPDCWRTVTLRRCIDQSRHVHGQRGTDHVSACPDPILIDPHDEISVLMTQGVEERGYQAVEDCCDLTAIIKDLPDDELAALARFYWLGIPAGDNTPAAGIKAKAMSHARGESSVRKAATKTPGRKSILTPREKQTLIYASHGLSRTEIAREMGISDQTVKTNLRNIARRLDARCTTHAVAIALRTGLID